MELQLKNTEQQWDDVIHNAFEIFIKKTIDYGTSWRILRGISLTDQIYIKAQRLRTLQEADEQKVSDSPKDEFIGIINYCIIGLIQIDPSNKNLPLEIEENKVREFYWEKVSKTKDLLKAKNHDYGEAWRQMRMESFVDLILQKLMRIKSIEKHNGMTIVSEGVDAGYYDCINYAIFALILIGEGANPLGERIRSNK